MTAVNPQITRLNFSVAITSAAASALGSGTTLPCCLYITNTIVGYQWQVAYQQSSGTWQLMSQGANAGVVYDPGEISALCTEINSVGIVAWIMKQAAWFNALMVSFFTGKVAGSTPTPPPSGSTTPQNFQDSINGTLATMAARDSNGDGIPELMMA